MSVLQEETAPRCANHPNVETLVSCSTCGKPICTDCMVHAPVGVKCRDCARMPRSALVRLKPQKAAMAIAATLGAALLIGVALAALNGTGFGFFGFLIAFAVGAVMAEIVTRTSGYYRGRESGIIAAAGSLLAYVVAWQAVPLLYTHTHLAGNWVTLQFVFGVVAAVVAYRRVA
jgi:MFS family permease